MEAYVAGGAKLAPEDDVLMIGSVIRHHWDREVVEGLSRLV